MSDPDCMFVQDALDVAKGDLEPNMILTRTPEGLYRKAAGADLARLGLEAPRFIREIKKRHRDESFYW